MILNDNSTQQINTLVIQLQNKITNLTNESRKLNNDISDLNNEISDLEKRVSSNENDADNNIGDLDSKISDLEKRVSSNENNAAAMNAEISANTEAISGKADKIHTHTKSQITDFPTSLKNPNALTINGKTYDGSSAVNAGVQTVANGGTGVTTQADINKAFIGNLDIGESDVTDGTEFVSSWASDNGFAETAEGAVNTPYKRKFSKVWNYIKGKISSVLGLTATDYSGKASTAGTADSANVPTGFEKIGNQDLWGNQDGVFITDWQTHTKEYGNSGDISFRYNKGQLNLIIDGVFYQNEGKYKLVDENSLKDIMKPNYTTGRLPAGVYKAGQTNSVSVSITTTRGNPVFISYSGDYNSVNQGSTVPWILFELFVDDQIVQRTSIDNSVALESDNTTFAGNALAVLSAGSHIIRLSASLIGNASGQIQFQEQDNLVNLVAFEL